MMITNESVSIPKTVTSQMLSDSLKVLLHDRYQILDILGQGGVRITYRAQDLANNQIVAIKSLSLRRAGDWKAIELFEREAKVLAQLNHPAIPRYIDYFQVDSDKDRQFYIVQTLAAGDSLANLVEKGWQPTTEEVQNIAAQVLGILSYLHTLIPAVIHRDIKPQNLIRNSDGDISLVDFGAVQDTYHTVTGGSTVVGTYGYMAPEQFRGQAYFSTDLYGLGTTLLHLLTRLDPGVLPQKKLKIDFRAYVKIPQKFADWIDRLLEPEIQRRFETADRALAVLQGSKELPLLAGQKPAHSTIKLTKSADKLRIVIPAVGLSNQISQQFSGLTLIWNIILFLLLFYSLTLGLIMDATKQAFFIMYGLCGLMLFFQWCYGILAKVTIDIRGDDLIITKALPKSKGVRQEFSLTNNSWQRQFASPCFPFDSCRQRAAQFVTTAERRWLLSEINAFIDRTASTRMLR
jgi:eukaryotic-like serine/threonine-protein kinase